MLSLPWLMFVFWAVLGGVFGWYLFSMAHRARRRRQAAEKEQHASDEARQSRQQEADIDETEKTEEKIIQLEKKYKFDYLVWKDSRGTLNLDKVYNQFGFTIYKMNNEKKNKK